MSSPAQANSQVAYQQQTVPQQIDPRLAGWGVAPGGAVKMKRTVDQSV